MTFDTTPSVAADGRPPVNEPTGPADGLASNATLRAILAALTARREALASIFDASAEALVAFDERRYVLRANRHAEQLFGYEPGALEGLSTDVLVPPRFRQPDAPPMIALTDLMQIDLPGLRRDGSELAVEWSFAAVPTPSGSVFVMTVRDREVSDRALEALRASEERFRLLVEGVHGYAMFMLDPEGRVTGWNQGAERIKGWSVAEVIGQSYEIFFVPEDREIGLPRQLLEAAARDGSADVDGWRMRKNGARFRVNGSLTALRTSNHELRGFAKITRDLSEVLQTEELKQRLEIEREGRMAAEAAELRVRASESRFRRLQRVAAALSEAATPQDVGRVVLRHSLEGFSADGGAIYSLSADGGFLELLDQVGHPEGPLASFATLPLEMQAPLTDVAREGIPRFYESFEACASLYPSLRSAIRSGEFEASAAIPLTTGRTLLGVLGIRFKAERAFDEADRSMLLTLAELCAQALERARLLAAESRARAEAEAANRSKDEFLAMLGHELRNPLAPIVTALSLMDLRGGEETKKERTVIGRQVNHLVRLVDDLLDVSRITRGKVELKLDRVELSEIVAQAVELASPLLEARRQHLTLDVPAAGLVVQGDSTRLAQVVSNLLANSAKYSGVGGHVRVEGRREDDRIVLTVADDGIGITPQMLPRVFDLFAQERQDIDRSQGGLGLGLAIVKSLITLHEGKVSATSGGRGQGSVFTIELPAARGPAAVSSAPPRTTARPSDGRRVLVVDDNEDAAELLAEVLRERGFVVEIALDGPAALVTAKAFRPQVALLDIGLPVMDGYELAHRLRADLDPIRLIAVTGYGQEADRARAREAGFDAHMIKPVALDALDAALGSPQLAR